MKYKGKFLALLCVIVVSSCHGAITDYENMLPSPQSPTILPASPSTLTPLPSEIYLNSPELLALKSNLRLIFVTYIQEQLWFWDGNMLQYLMDLEYVDKNLTKLSPDGTHLLLATYGDEFGCYDIWVIGTNDASKQLIMSEKTMKEIAPDCSEYVREETGGWAFQYQSGWLSNNRQFLWNFGALGETYIFDIDANEHKKIFSVGEPSAIVLSPDREKVAYLTEHSVSIISLEDKHQSALVEFKPIQVVTSPYFVDVMWNNISTALAIKMPPVDSYELENATTTIWLLHILSQTPSIIAEIPTPPLLVTPSPDLNWIAYTVRISEYRYECHLLQASTNVDRLYLNRDCRSLQWLPDSLHFTFDPGNRKDYLGSVSETSDLVILLDGYPYWLDNDNYLTISPDGYYFIKSLSNSSINLFAFDIDMNRLFIDFVVIE